jgi:hypothetical protein
MAHIELSRSDIEHPLTDIREIERWASLAAATAVLAYGFSRRSVPGVALAAAAATPFAYRTFSGKWPFENGDTHRALAGDRGIHVREAVRLEKPVSEVYAFGVSSRTCRASSRISNRSPTSATGAHTGLRVDRPILGVEWDAEIINDG